YQVNNNFNPLYSEISSKLATSQIDFITLNNRLNAFNNLLQKSYMRQKQIANNQAELTNLNRDNTVTKKLYEDMLANKEKARLSMVLDIQGQGVNYKIQEPENYPIMPSGLRFLDFIIAGPILAFIIIFALFGIKIILDTKIRFPSQLINMQNFILIANFKNTQSPSEKCKSKNENKLLCLYFLIAFSVYIAFAVIHKYHISLSQILHFMAEII
ncbi:chain length-determining protein, partial [Psychromonas sp. PRT-SC03]